MNRIHIKKISEEHNLRSNQVEATALLLEDNATVPFIARYRKEATGGLDEVAIITIRDRIAQLRDLDERRESILKSLTEREILTDELKEKILAAETLASLEDIYLPYRPKRRTRATVAREKGLEPLAQLLFSQNETIVPLLEAASFIDVEKGVLTAEDALSGARDIIAEWVNEDQDAREYMRRLFMEKGSFRSTVIPGMEEKGAKFRDYFDYVEPVHTVPSHRVLAIRRGEKEIALELRILPPEDEVLSVLEKLFVKNSSKSAAQVSEAVKDAYKRLLSCSMETETRITLRKRADTQAILVFADNLKELLLAAPLGQKCVMAIDPGIRTGCKIVCLDRLGKILAIDTIYLFSSDKNKSIAEQTVSSLCETHKIEAIAIGNGTAGRETEAFIRGLDALHNIPIVLVSETGASVYSASKVARDEFPDLDVSYRGSVSIGRRLIDPLAELVKIDPKSIGVGQYQHDVDQKALKACLDDVVVSCVNAVGVDVNTASEQLLAYVSGLGTQLAKNLVAFRNEIGSFTSRTQLLKIPRLGPKAFEQSAGFLRIRNSSNPLDGSAVHPESYKIVEQIASDLKCPVKSLIGDYSVRNRVKISMYVTDKVGIPTLTDILNELSKPGRDPRSKLEIIKFAEGLNKLEDLKVGMKLPGVVTNVTAFGAFIDVGVHQDGLVHISQLADRFVKDTKEVVKVHQKVTVTVLDVDLSRKRLALSMKQTPLLNAG
ncbi:MAG: Tex family protein [Pseudomonadota bacterium]